MLPARPPSRLAAVPRTLQDDVHVAFESALDLGSTALRIQQSDVERLPELLQAVAEERRHEMQRSLARIWQRSGVRAARSCCG